MSKTPKKSSLENRVSIDEPEQHPDDEFLLPTTKVINDKMTKDQRMLKRALLLKADSKDGMFTDREA